MGERNLELINGHFTSYFISPNNLFRFRVGSLAISVAMLIWIISYNFVTNNPPFIVKYYTNLSWIGLVIYFIIFIFLSYRQDKMKSMNDRKKYWTIISLEALVSLTQTVVWMVVLVYWIQLSKDIPTLSSDHAKAINVIEHLIDLGLVVSEMFLTRSWINYYSFVFPLAIAWLYTFWTWIFVYTGVWKWPYGFFEGVLNPNERAAWVTVVGIIGGSIIVIVIFFIVYGTFRIREFYGKKRGKDVTPAGSTKGCESPTVVQVDPLT